MNVTRAHCPPHASSFCAIDSAAEQNGSEGVQPAEPAAHARVDGQMRMAGLPSQIPIGGVHIGLQPTVTIAPGMH